MAAADSIRRLYGDGRLGGDRYGDGGLGGDRYGDGRPGGGKEVR